MGEVKRMSKMIKIVMVMVMVLMMGLIVEQWLKRVLRVNF